MRSLQLIKYKNAKNIMPWVTDCEKSFLQASSRLRQSVANPYKCKLST